MKLARNKHNSNASTRSVNYRVITIEQPSSIAAECYRRVKVSLENSETEKALKVIQIVSSTQGEGKTTTLLNIAATYGENNKKVIVVDLDLRRPTLHRCFGIKNENGITDVLEGKIKLDEAIKHSDKLNFDGLNRGSSAAYPTTLLNSPELKDLFEQLKEMYDVILVDCPPVLSVSDSIIIAPLCDGVLFLINQQVSDKDLVKESISLLRKDHVNVLGCVYIGVNYKSIGEKKYAKYYTNYYRDSSKK